jgi:hypothetical protein
VPIGQASINLRANVPVALLQIQLPALSEINNVWKYYRSDREGDRSRGEVSRVGDGAF